MSTPTSARPARRARRPRPLLRLLVGLVVIVAVFALGLALGEALHDNPSGGGTQTLVRTLKPLPLPPARVTVTVSR
ncbi:MAG: hypothetical protein ACM3QU_13825 [Verrucomicrobiota bacterium]